VADLDQIYDLALPDDRLILGVKGSVSEYELSLFRQRSQQAIVAKAKRGALTFTRPAGLSWTPDGQIELHLDRRVQHAIRLVLDKLSELGSVRQVPWGCATSTYPCPPSRANARARLPDDCRPTGWCCLSCAAPSMRGPTPSVVVSRTRVVDGRVTRTSGHAKPMAQSNPGA